MSAIAIIDRAFDYARSQGKFPTELRISEKFYDALKMATGFQRKEHLSRGVGYYRGALVIFVQTKKRKGSKSGFHPDTICTLVFSDKDPKEKKDVRKRTGLAS